MTTSMWYQRCKKNYYRPIGMSTTCLCRCTSYLSPNTLATKHDRYAQSDAITRLCKIKHWQLTNLFYFRLDLLDYFTSGLRMSLWCDILHSKNQYQLLHRDIHKIINFCIQHSCCSMTMLMFTNVMNSKWHIYK